MVKIRKVLHDKRNDRDYYKYQISISKEDMAKLGWDENTQVKRKVVGKKFIVEEEK